MTTRISTGWLLGPCIALGFALGLFLSAEPAHAHGGRIIKPKVPWMPGGGGLPPASRPTTPPPFTGPTPPPPNTPPPPRTPGGNPGTPGQTPTTGRRPRPKASAAEANWATWWELNRWAYFPDRGALSIAGRPVTVTARPADPMLRPSRVLARKREVISKKLILPFLLHCLDPKTEERAEVIAAAALALARSCNDTAAAALILGLAENKDATIVERESAALAAGLLRRDDPKRQFPGKTLDLVRIRLLALYDNEDVPDRARAFALFSLGMLADQPYGTELAQHGQLTVKALWERLQIRDNDREATIALLTSLGMHPSQGIPEQLTNDLRRVVFGRNCYRRAWSADERSHALTALGRWATPNTFVTMLRVVADRRLPTPIRRAGFMALGRGAVALDTESRVRAAQAVERGVRSASDSLTRGLAQIALGRLLGADLRAGKSSVYLRTDVADYLLGQARNAPTELYGFSVLALALSARDLGPDHPQASAHASASAALVLREFERASRNAARREPLVLALGLLQAAEGLDTLNEIVGDRRQASTLRGHAAISLGLLGRPENSTVKELRKALNDHRSAGLSSDAALALSFIRGRQETKFLIDTMKAKPSQWVQAQIAAALGHLGDVEAVDAVLAIAHDKTRMEETRALAVASLGLLADPHARPGLFRLTRDANYFARTEALAEAFTIL